MSIEEEPNSELCITFPCHFPLKVMGENNDTFEQEMMMIVRKHVPKLGEAALKSKPSKTGKYLALTISFTADSKTQLDELYREINAHEAVKMTL